MKGPCPRLFFLNSILHFATSIFFILFSVVFNILLNKLLEGNVFKRPLSMIMDSCKELWRVRANEETAEGLKSSLP